MNIHTFLLIERTVNRVTQMLVNYKTQSVTFYEKNNNMKILRKIKRGLGFTCITICLIIYLKELYEVSDWRTINSYYSDEGDVLPSAENLSFAPKSDISLFFHETSYNGILTARKACAVEAAARAHPKLEVYVLFSAPVTNYNLETTCLAKLLRFPNVKFLRVHIAEFSKGTVVQSILLNDLKKSRFPIQHTADILRILTLNKWGGISLESDMIVLRPLDLLPDLNWIVQQGGKFVAPGLLSFAKDKVGSNVTSSILA